MTASPVRVGLVGCGRLAERGYVPAAAVAQDVRIVAVADPDVHRRRVLAARAARSGAADTVVTDHRDAAALLERAAVDALVLATPADRHVADAELAVERGVPVLVEKPPAPDAAGAARLVELGPLVHVGFNRRFDPSVAELRAAVPPGGDVDLHLELRYRRASWDAHTVRDEVVADLAPHLVDLARWLSGRDIGAVAARELTPDRATLVLDLGDRQATIEVAAEHLHRERIEVRAPGGRLLARHRTGGPVAALMGRSGAILARLAGRARPHPLAASLASQLDALAAAVHGEPLCGLGSAAEGLVVMYVIDAARTSAASGGAPVPLTDLPERPSC